MPRGAPLSVVLTNGRCVILGVLTNCSACSDVVFANIGCGQVVLPNTSVITGKNCPNYTRPFCMIITLLPSTACLFAQQIFPQSCCLLLSFYVYLTTLNSKVFSYQIIEIIMSCLYTVSSYIADIPRMLVHKIKYFVL